MTRDLYTIHVFSSSLTDRWVLGANDPDWVGWLTTAAYMVSAGLCWSCAKKIRGLSTNEGGHHRWMWWVLAAVMLLLGINKQLDLQTPFIAFCKQLAIAEGWYHHRQVARWGFIAGLGTAGFVILALLLVALCHGGWRQYGLAVGGLVSVLVFVLIRASSFHIGDVIHWASRIPGKRHLAEAFGIGCIGISAAIHLRRLHLPGKGN